MNCAIATVIVAPMTSRGRGYPSRVKCRFAGKDRQVVLDQIRTVNRVRLVKKLGRIAPSPRRAVLETLASLFAE